jgi:uncharacterized protein (DUF111 family)
VPATLPGPQELHVLEANVDDLDPRLWPALLGRLMEIGAADAWLTPILMKKGRPAHTVSVLIDAASRAAALRVLFTESSTLGVREHGVNRSVLQRTEMTVAVDGHPLRVKVAQHDGRVVNVQPEYEDVVQVAAATGRPLKVVLAQAIAAAGVAW